MTTGGMVLMAAILAVFAVFSITLAWAARKTRDLKSEKL